MLRNEMKYTWNFMEQQKIGIPQTIEMDLLVYLAKKDPRNIEKTIFQNDIQKFTTFLIKGLNKNEIEGQISCFDFILPCFIVIEIGKDSNMLRNKFFQIEKDLILFNNFFNLDGNKNIPMYGIIITNNLMQDVIIEIGLLMLHFTSLVPKKDL